MIQYTPTTLSLDFINNLAVVNGEDYALNKTLTPSRTNAFDNLISFSRGTLATVTESTGNITFAPNNLLTYSEQIDNAIWVKEPGGVGSAPSVSADAALSPSGTKTADRVIFSLNGGTTSSDFSRIRQTVTIPTYANGIFSFYIRSYDGISSYTMTARNPSGTVQSFTVTGSWQRISLQAPGAGAVSFIISLIGGQTPTNANFADVLIWGAQAEAVTYQTTARTYIATTSEVYYGPRFDYDPVALTTKGLLIEEGRTNTQTYSSDISGASWSLSTVSTAAGVNLIGSGSSINQITAPDGTTSADFISEFTNNGRHYFFGTIFSDSATKTWSIFLKAGARSKCRIQIGDTAMTNGVYCDIDLSTGTIGSATSIGTGYTIVGTPQIQNFGNGWYRCSISATTPASSNVGYVGIRNNTGSISYTGDGTSGIYVWGGQMELGAFATSYIPTSASTVTRNAETVLLSGTSFSSWFNLQQGSFVGQANILSSSGGSTLVNLRSGASNANEISLYQVGAAPVFSMNSGGASQFSLVPSGSVVGNTTFKLAGAYSQYNSSATFNGGTTATNTTGALPQTLDRMWIGSAAGSVNWTNGWIRNINYYPKRLPDTVLQSLTT